MEKLFILFLCLFLIRMLMDLIIGFHRNERLKHIEHALSDIEVRLRERNDVDAHWKRNLISEMNRDIMNMMLDRSDIGVGDGDERMDVDD